jgi:HSP20 family molecular chaperone IbpA
MSRTSPLNSPLLLGFDEIERILDRVGKSSGEGYPPYNIERLANGDDGELLRITLAVAGFTQDQLDVSVEDSQLTISGKQEEDDDNNNNNNNNNNNHVYLHRGIAARQFSRTFVLANGIEVRNADLSNGLLSIDLERPELEQLIRKVEITQAN